MVRKIIAWAVHQPLVVLLLVVALAIGGGYAFLHINVEAYPDPAPPMIEVVAQNPGASGEEMERLVTMPLEVTLAGMPGLHSLRSKSLFGLSNLRNQFDYGVDYWAARQEVINRLQFTQPLPPGVQPQISPESPIGEIYRYSPLEQGPAGARHLHAQRPQGAAGLDAGARVPPRAADRRRHQFRRHGETLRDPSRPATG